jgi:hypothetical protein
MWLIDRHGDGRQSRRIPLPAPVTDALVRWYIGAGSRQDEEAAIMLVQQARIGERWIACGCRGADEEPAILTPAYLSEAETYYLRRLTGAGRPEHRADCPFFREQATNRISEVRALHTPSDPPEGLFEVLKPAPENLAQRPEEDSSDDRTRHASIPRLARLLWRLMSLAGICRIPPPSEEQALPSIGGEFKRLSAAAGKIEIAPGMELARAFWTHGDALHSRRAYASLRALAQNWPQGHAPQAFLSVFATSIKGSTIELAGADPIRIANRVQSPSIRANVVKGPYLVLIVIGEYPEAKGYAPLRAYAQPIYSGQRFVAVETEFERKVLRELIEFRRSADHQGIDVTIDKPLFDQLTPAGPCRPDFVVHAVLRITGEVRTVIVEAMDHGTEDHLSARATAHERMAAIAPVLAVGETEYQAGDCPRLLAARFGL